jgi:hypothetical protein
MVGTPVKRARREKALAVMESPAFWDQLWIHLAEGNSLSSFVKGSEIPYQLLWETIQADPARHEKFELVRTARALANAERIERLAEQVEEERIDPNAAKVAMGARQWLAERMDPKRWGNKIQSDVRITDTTALHLAAVRDLMRTVSVQEPEKLTHDAPTSKVPRARS